MSAIELAVRKVRKLSAAEARELLDWLATRPSNGRVVLPSARPAQRKTTDRQRLGEACFCLPN